MQLVYMFTIAIDLRCCNRSLFHVCRVSHQTMAKTNHNLALQHAGNLDNVTYHGTIFLNYPLHINNIVSQRKIICNI